jgi:hypothetical protein
MAPKPATTSMQGFQARQVTAMNAPTNLPPSTLPAAYRSEAFAEDLFEMSGFRSAPRETDRAGGEGRRTPVAAPWLTALPVVVAVLGGVLAWWQAG